MGTEEDGRAQGWVNIHVQRSGTGGARCRIERDGDSRICSIFGDHHHADRGWLAKWGGIIDYIAVPMEYAQSTPDILHERSRTVYKPMASDPARTATANCHLLVGPVICFKVSFSIVKCLFIPLTESAAFVVAVAAAGLVAERVPLVVEIALVTTAALARDEEALRTALAVEFVAADVEDGLIAGTVPVPTAVPEDCYRVFPSALPSSLTHLRELKLDQLTACAFPFELAAAAAAAHLMLGLNCSTGP